jgi:predicted acylesterase/phospholipase RssA/CRP-like cAMP-binding protein
MKSRLQEIPFFSGLDDHVLAAISRRLKREHYHKDAVIFFEGEPGDCMYIIESGQVKVVTERGGEERILSYLGPGNFFGEMALLLGERRSATARVVIDAELLVLRKDDFDELLQLHPQIAIKISQELGRRLTQTTVGPALREEFNIVTTLGVAVPALARHLAQVTGEMVTILDVGGLANVTLDVAALRQANVVLLREDILEPERLADRLGQLVEQYYWVLLSVAPYETPLTLKAIELADVTVHLGEKEPGWLKMVPLKKYWRVDAQPPAIQRLARRIAQRLVGVALSSGNARGMAHIGVLHVLEQEGIPVDMLAGTSAGAVFGALYAAGRSIEEMTTFAQNVQWQYNFITGFKYWDFRLPPRAGLIKGKQALEYLREWLWNKTFDELRIPLYIVATDLISGEEIIFDRGPVAEAVRASMSVIGVFEPAQVAGRFLIDGGAVNPVPTQVLAERGANIILASNVIPSLEERIHRRSLRRTGKLPGMMTILTGALEIMESEIIRNRLGPVDVLIQPQVAELGTLEYDKATEFIKRGEEAARLQIPAIRQRLTPTPRKRSL